MAQSSINADQIKIQSMLRFNLTDRKTLQFHKLNYFIKQRVITSDVLNKERILKAVQYLYLINLIKPNTVYILAHHWHNLTVVSKVHWNE